ncbi:14184_t:CDS:2 [Cetraspora pellucida]|uniref:14184_t:CDS:1 n=1 Tax=Cetraspora pellucida TaxID=1433469 RepID=A0A9N8WGT9_9GLOM|nr:14184_t:CDS:2 [Cetraspora pellucida]
MLSWKFTTLLLLFSLLFNVVFTSPIEVARIRKKCRGLQVVYPARSGIIYRDGESQWVMLRSRGIHSDPVILVNRIRLYYVEPDTENYKVVKTLSTVTKPVRKGSITNFKIKLSIPKKFEIPGRYFYRIYGMTISGRTCYVDSVKFNIM